MARQRKESGFSAVQALLITIVIALIGGIGYYVYSVNNNTDDIYTQTTGTSNQPAVTPNGSNPKSTSQSGINDAERLQNASRNANPDSITTKSN